MLECHRAKVLIVDCQTEIENRKTKSAMQVRSFRVPIMHLRGTGHMAVLIFHIQ